MEAVTNFIILGFKITVDHEYNHEIKRHLLLGRKAMTCPGGGSLQEEEGQPCPEPPPHCPVAWAPLDSKATLTHTRRRNSTLNSTHIYHIPTMCRLLETGAGESGVWRQELESWSLSWRQTASCPQKACKPIGWAMSNCGSQATCTTINIHPRA